MKNYIEESERTNTGLKININEGNEDLLHAVLGINTESGELTDALKKHLYYGAPLNLINLQEELGDLLWYIARACKWLGISFEDLMEANINKLKVRYPEKWNQDNAINRDTTKEMKAFEKDLEFLKKI